MPVALPFSFTNGTIADATQVNANFNAVANVIQSTGASVTTFTNAPANAAAGTNPFSVCDVNLTPGDWDVHGVILFNFNWATAGTPGSWEFELAAYVNNVPNAYAAADIWNQQTYANWNPYPAQSEWAVPTFDQRVNVSTAGIYYLTGWVWSNTMPPSLTYKASLVARRMGDFTTAFIAPIAGLADVSRQQEMILARHAGGASSHG